MQRSAPRKLALNRFLEMSARLVRSFFFSLLSRLFLFLPLFPLSLIQLLISRSLLCSLVLRLACLPHLSKAPQRCNSSSSLSRSSSRSPSDSLEQKETTSIARLSKSASLNLLQSTVLFLLLPSSVSFRLLSRFCLALSFGR